MAWTTPLTAVSNAALTAAQWNASVRDNLLETAAAKATQSGSYFVGTGANSLTERVCAMVSASGTATETSTSFVDSGGVGPTVTLTTGTKALGFITAFISNNTVNAKGLVGLNITGATTVSPVDSLAMQFVSSTANAGVQASQAMMYILTAGSNSFNLLYRVTAGTGTFADQRVTIMPF